MAAHAVVASSHSLRRVDPARAPRRTESPPFPPRVAPAWSHSPRRVAAPGAQSVPRVAPPWSESPVCKAQSPLEKAPVAEVASPVAPFPWSQSRRARSHWDHRRSQWDQSRSHWDHPRSQWDHSRSQWDHSRSQWDHPWSHSAKGDPTSVSTRSGRRPDLRPRGPPPGAPGASDLAASDLAPRVSVCLTGTRPGNAKGRARCSVARSPGRMVAEAKRAKRTHRPVTDDQLAPPVKHFINQYAKAFTRVSGTTGRRASISAAQGNGGFLAKDFLVRPLVLSSPRPPPPPSVIPAPAPTPRRIKYPASSWP